MADFFDFESLTKNDANPFDDSTNYTQTKDERFYTISKDDKGSGNGGFFLFLVKNSDEFI